MATIKQGDKNYLEEHSKEKIAFYKQYLDLYLTVLLNNQYVKTINIYDIFCGVGIYNGDGSKGSPVVAMETIKKHMTNNQDNKNKSISLLINDGDKRKVEIAKKYIADHSENKFILTANNLQAKEIFDLITNKIKVSNNNENHFIFIDPHGYKDIYKKDIATIMDSSKSEILIFLPIHQMYRFSKGTMKIDTTPSANNSLKRFIIEFGLNYNTTSPAEYIENVTNSFSYGGKYYTVNYNLRATNSRNLYALFFITKNLRGLEKAIETKWKLDNICGKGLEKKQPKSLFEEEEEENKREDCIGGFAKKLKEYLNEERTNNELFEFTLRNGFLIKHTNGILKQLAEAKKLIFDRKIRKNSFYLRYDYHKEDIIKYKVKFQ